MYCPFFYAYSHFAIFFLQWGTRACLFVCLFLWISTSLTSLLVLLISLADIHHILFTCRYSQLAYILLEWGTRICFALFVFIHFNYSHPYWFYSSPLTTFTTFYSHTFSSCLYFIRLKNADLYALFVFIPFNITVILIGFIHLPWLYSPHFIHACTHLSHFFTRLRNPDCVYCLFIFNFISSLLALLIYLPWLHSSHIVHIDSQRFFFSWVNIHTQIETTLHYTPLALIIIIIFQRSLHLVYILRGHKQEGTIYL